MQQEAKWLAAVRGGIRSVVGTPRLFLIFFASGFQILAHILTALGPKSWQPLFTSLSVILWLIFFAWRSYSIYFYPAAILMFAVVVLSHRRSVPALDLTGRLKPANNMDHALLPVGQS